MKRILFFQCPWRMERARLAGAYRFAEEAGWQMEVIEQDLMPGSPRKLLKFWHPDGCIVEGEYTERKNFRQQDYDGIPTVYCDARSARMSEPYNGVLHDSAQTALLGMRELERLEIENFAYVGFLQLREWSVSREQVVTRYLMRKGKPLQVFRPGRYGDIGGFTERLEAWLLELPKPCGLLAVNDVIANLVLKTCRHGLIRVPEDIAVVGIDNDVQLCEHAFPTLTSVVPDFEQSGYEAARLLERAMRDPALPPKIVRFGASRIVRRNSTTAFGRYDEAVLKAVEQIRLRFASGLSAAEVCAQIGGSRRQAECRFAKVVGHSIGEQIRLVRLARAKELLAKRNVPIESIAAACGYRDSSSLRRAFVKATGLSLRNWQRGVVDGVLGTE